jgi:hypothetical protein
MSAEHWVTIVVLNVNNSKTGFLTKEKFKFPELSMYSPVNRISLKTEIRGEKCQWKLGRLVNFSPVPVFGRTVTSRILDFAQMQNFLILLLYQSWSINQMLIPAILE